MVITPKMGVIIVIVISNGTFDDFGVLKNDQKSMEVFPENSTRTNKGCVIYFFKLLCLNQEYTFTLLKREKWSWATTS